MTADEAIEAGILAEALRAIPELIAEAQDQATGPLEVGQTRWKMMGLEIWAQNHEDDGSQDRVGPTVRLPPIFAVRALEGVKRDIAARLVELGVKF